MNNGRDKNTPNIHKAEQPNGDMTAEDLLKGYAFAKHRNEHGVAVDSWYRVLQTKLDTAKHLEEMIAASIRIDSARNFPWKKQVKTFFRNVEVVDALQQFSMDSEIIKKKWEEVKPHTKGKKPTSNSKEYVTRIQEDLNDLMIELADNVVRNQELNLTVSHLSEERDLAEVRVHALELDRDAAAEQLHALQDSCAQQVSILSSSLAEKDTELAQLREQILMLEALQARVSSAEANEAALRTEKAALQARLEEAGAEMDKLLDEKDQVEDQLTLVLPFKQQAETLASDLAAKKREIAKLKKDKDDSEAKGASAKLTDVLFELGPILDNLMLCTEPEELHMLLQDEIDALSNAGAVVIGQIGEETHYNPAVHQYIGQGKIGRDTLVIIENIGFMVGERVIHPAKVKAKEVQ